MFAIEKLVRKNILNLKPYSSAREEYKGRDAIFLDANEGPFASPYNRYPDPLQVKVKDKIGALLMLSPPQIFLGNGSDEAIDLLMRCFCEPGSDNIIIIDPSYGMYEVCADINHVKSVKVSLTPDFQLDTQSILNSADEDTKMIILCSPNNPTANCFRNEDIVNALDHFHGIVVLDEAYIDFSEKESFITQISRYPNLVILRTFSKAWGMAGIRLGLAIASPEIIRILNKIKYPYNVNAMTQSLALERLDKVNEKNSMVHIILDEKKKLLEKLNKFSFIQRIYPSDANFILVKFDHARKVYDYLITQRIVVRDRSGLNLCDNCLRITIGTPEENLLLLKALEQYKPTIPLIF